MSFDAFKKLSYEQNLFSQDSVLSYLSIKGGFKGATLRVDQIQKKL